MFIALILVVSYFSLTSGSFSVRPAEPLSTLFQIDPNPQYEVLLFDLRLPRVVMATIIGLGLGIAGAVIQAITRNGLADPGILGINAGAGAGIVAFMLLFQGQKEVTSILAAMGMPFRIDRRTDCGDPDLHICMAQRQFRFRKNYFGRNRDQFRIQRTVFVFIIKNGPARLSNGHGVEKRKHLVCQLDVYHSRSPMDAAVYTDSYRQVPLARHHSF